MCSVCRLFAVRLSRAQRVSCASHFKGCVCSVFVCGLFVVRVSCVQCVVCVVCLCGRCVLCVVCAVSVVCIACLRVYMFRVVRRSCVQGVCCVSSAEGG